MFSLPLLSVLHPLGDDHLPLGVDKAAIEARSYALDRHLDLKAASVAAVDQAGAVVGQASRGGGPSSSSSSSGAGSGAGSGSGSGRSTDVASGACDSSTCSPSGYDMSGYSYPVLAGECLPRCLAALKRIVDAANAAAASDAGGAGKTRGRVKIVLSSTWRQTPEMVRQCYHDLGQLPHVVRL